MEADEKVKLSEVRRQIVLKLTAEDLTWKSNKCSGSKNIRAGMSNTNKCGQSVYTSE